MYLKEELSRDTQLQQKQKQFIRKIYTSRAKTVESPRWLSGYVDLPLTLGDLSLIFGTHMVKGEN